MTQEEKNPTKEQDEKHEKEEFEYIEKIQKYREEQLKNNKLFTPGY
jgi:hypothetical protein